MTIDMCAIAHAYARPERFDGVVPAAQVVEILAAGVICDPTRLRCPDDAVAWRGGYP